MATEAADLVVQYPATSGDYDQFVKDEVLVVDQADDDLKSGVGRFDATDANGAVEWLVSRGCDPAKAHNMIGQVLARREEVLREIAAAGTDGSGWAKCPGLCRRLKNSVYSLS